MRSVAWTVAVVGVLLAARPAGAQIVYEFADSSGVARTNFSVPVASSIPIQVYIHEITAGAPTLNSDGGLGTGAVRVTFNNPSGVAAVQSTADISAATPPWAFGSTG